MTPLDHRPQFGTDEPGACQRCAGSAVRQDSAVVGGGYVRPASRGSGPEERLRGARGCTSVPECALSDFSRADGRCIRNFGGRSDRSRSQILFFGASSKHSEQDLRSAGRFRTSMRLSLRLKRRCVGSAISRRARVTPIGGPGPEDGANRPGPPPHFEQPSVPKGER